MTLRKETSQPAPEVPDEILAEAAAWLLRVRERPQDEPLEAALIAWRQADASHEEAWQTAEASWEAAGHPEVYASTDLSGADASSADIAFLHPPTTRRRIRTGYVIAWGIAACLACFLLYPAVTLWLGADYSTAKAETRMLTLADGSFVMLGADSAIAVDFSTGTRQISLLQGEAFFQVMPDKNHPFLVHAKLLDVQVTGTAFSVSQSDHATSVAVAEGSVRATIAADASTQDLKPGDRLTVNDDIDIATRDTVGVTDIAAWRTGRLILQDATIADAVDILARYQPGFIVIQADDLARRRITGVFDLGDPLRALRGVIGPSGAVLHQVTPYLTIISPP